MRRIYVAAPWQLRASARDVQRRLEDVGHIITSHWVTDDRGENDNTDATARRNLHDIDVADIVVCLNPWSFAEHGTGGRHVELGYAVAMRKTILVIGRRTNIFHYLDAVTIVKTMEEALDWLLVHDTPQVEEKK